MAQATKTIATYPGRGSLVGRNRTRDLKEGAVGALLIAAAAGSMLTTFGIILSLFGETLVFFR